METYRIKCSTDGYHASRNAKFKDGRTSYTVEGGLSLRQAQSKLLGLYNELYEDERPYCRNWGLAVIQSAPHVFGARDTAADGTRSFTWDVYTYEIEEEEGEEE